MTLWQAAILGLVQGATEFLPVSSSGHLVIVPALLGWQSPPVSFDVAVHLGTLVALAAAYWHDLAAIVKAQFVRSRPEGAPEAEGGVARRLLWLLLVATVPAGVVGLALGHRVEGVFADPRAAAWFLLASGAYALVAHFAAGRRSLSGVRWLDAIVLGIYQAAAILPGVSRSGSTIAAGAALGLDRRTAPRFAFLMSFPVILGGAVAGLPEMGSLAPADLVCYGVGVFAAAVSGYAAIRLVVAALLKRGFWVFAVYCWLVSLGALAWLGRLTG